MRRFTIQGGKIVPLLSSLIAFNINSFGQSKASGNERLKEQIIAFEKAEWEAWQDGVCGNSRLAAKIRVSATYIKQRAKWREGFYMETPLIE